MTKARDLASATPAPSTVSATELGYLDGVTSAIQTQIDSKSATSHNHDATYSALAHNHDSAYLNQSVIDAKGDLFAGTGDNAYARLAVGSNNQVLTADSSTATGLKWATASSGGMTLLASGNLSGSVNLTSIPGDYVDLVLDLINFRSNSGYQTQVNLGVNNFVAGLYQVGYQDFRQQWYGPTGTSPTWTARTDRANSLQLGFISGSQSTGARIIMPQYTAPAGQIKQFIWEGHFFESNSIAYINGAGRTTSSGISAIGPITSIQLSGFGNFGTYRLYGVR